MSGRILIQSTDDEMATEGLFDYLVNELENHRVFAHIVYQPPEQAAIERASPDLLEALKRAHEALDGARMGFPVGSGQREIFTRARDDAAAAIAKAEAAE